MKPAIADGHAVTIHYRLTLDDGSIAGCGCPDADGDSVCDVDDRCPGEDDTVDMDGDGTPAEWRNWQTQGI